MQQKKFPYQKFMARLCLWSVLHTHKILNQSLGLMGSEQCIQWVSEGLTRWDAQHYLVQFHKTFLSYLLLHYFSFSI